MSGPSPEFDGRVAMVSGAASGIGLAVARLLLERGARVALFLLSPRASFVTGAVFLADGGYTAR